MDEELEKNIDSNQDSEKKYKHISEKKNKFSVKKISRFIFFIIVVVCVVFLTNRTTQHFVDKHDEKIIRKMFEKMDEDKKITNYYEKKRWNEEVTRETWRKDKNYLVRDTYDNGRVSDMYYIDGVYYIVRDAVDDINGVITKKVTKMTNMSESLPNLGLQATYAIDNNREDDIKNWAKEAVIKSTTVDGVKYYQISLKSANESYFIDKSSYRVLRELKLYKDENDGKIKMIDTGFLELKVDSVTDENIALPDISGYEVTEYDLNEEMKKRQNEQDAQNKSETVWKLPISEPTANQ